MSILTSTDVSYVNCCLLPHNPQVAGHMKSYKSPRTGSSQNKPGKNWIPSQRNDLSSHLSEENVDSFIMKLIYGKIKYTYYEGKYITHRDLSAIDVLIYAMRNIFFLEYLDSSLPTTQQDIHSHRYQQVVYHNVHMEGMLLVEW